LAFQRDLGGDEILLPEPWLPPAPATLPPPTPQVPEAISLAAMVREVAEPLSLPESKPLPVPRETAKLEEKSFPHLAAFQEALVAVVEGLHPMPAKKGASPIIYGKGFPNPLLAVVTLQPMVEAGPDDGPFAGEDGLLLARMLKAIRLEISDMYCTSLMKRVHPGRGWPRRDAAKMVPWLAAEIRLIRPRVILALGEEITQILVRTGAGYADLRQKSHEFAGFECTMTLNPSLLLVEEARKGEAWKDLQWLSQRLQTLEAGP